jgi:uncharacterized protein (TIGR04255 family)
MPSEAATPVSSVTSRLPDYANPPVIETILGVQFDPLAKLKNAHLALFWDSLNRSEWPNIVEAQPVEPQFERFADGGEWVTRAVQLQVLKNLPNRLQIKNRVLDRLVQVQNGRLIFNWLGLTGSSYPHYENVREEFANAFRKFQKFLEAEALGELRANQWEVTYLNHIPKGTVWKSSADWGFFLPLGAVPTIPDVIKGESFNGEWHFVIPERRGRLHISWQHSKRKEPAEVEVVVLNLTARGPLEPSNSDEKSVFDGLDLGHATIVRTFHDLMSSDANAYWGLKNAENYTSQT